MIVIKEQGKRLISLPAKEISIQRARVICAPLAQRIMQELLHMPSYPRALAKKLGEHEQKIYYHIRNLESAGVITVIDTKTIGGAKANIYSLKKPAIVIRLGAFEDCHAVMGKQDPEFLKPFIEDGQLNAVIVAGSPDPHGPEMARSRDGYYGMDIALFFGTFLSSVRGPCVKLDTEAREEDLKENLILIGGPIVNNITRKINNKLPIKFDKKRNWAVFSKISNKYYLADEIGIIVKTKNPFNSRKRLLLIAGKKHMGTRAAMLAFLKHFDKICEGNRFNPKQHAKVVEGRDFDADGIVDDVEVHE